MNVTEKVQEAPEANRAGEAGHVVVSEYELASAPVKVIAVIESAEPVFFSVTVFGALATPTVVLAKVRLGGVKVTLPCEEIQAFTRFVALTEPSPVARSYPLVVV